MSRKAMKALPTPSLVARAADLVRSRAVPGRALHGFMHGFAAAAGHGSDGPWYAVQAAHGLAMSNAVRRPFDLELTTVWPVARRVLSDLLRQMGDPAVPVSSPTELGAVIWALLYHGVSGHVLMTTDGHSEASAIAKRIEAVISEQGKLIDNAVLRVMSERVPPTENPFDAGAALAEAWLGVTCAAAPGVYELVDTACRMTTVACMQSYSMTETNSRLEQALRRAEEQDRLQQKARARIEKLETALKKARTVPPAPTRPVQVSDFEEQLADLNGLVRVATQRAVRAKERVVFLETRVEELEHELGKRDAAASVVTSVAAKADAVTPAEPPPPPAPLNGLRVYLFTNREQAASRDAMRERLLQLGAAEAKIYEFGAGAAPGPTVFPDRSVVLVDITFAGHKDTASVRARVKGSDVFYAERAFGVGRLEDLVRETVDRSLGPR